MVIAYLAGMAVGMALIGVVMSVRAQQPFPEGAFVRA